MKHRITFACLAAAFAVVTAGAGAEERDRDFHTATPIKHLVVIFQENVSYDHYFATYPKAQNNAGETSFLASPRTPPNNNLVTPLDVDHNFMPLTGGPNLLTHNPNDNPAAPGNGRTNGTDAANPFRLTPAQVLTADQGHNESPEESAYDNGKMDGFPAWVGTAGPPINTKGLVMGYFDGNTVTALWNYAQHFALNDNNYTTHFGPSTPGAINLVSGQTNGLAAVNGNVVSGTGTLLHPTHEAFGDSAHLTSNITVIGDGDPLGDTCSNPTIDQVRMSGQNIGDLLNAKGITWGSFMGGFDLTVVNPANPAAGIPAPTTGCARLTAPTGGTVAIASVDYIPHHAWFQYYASTSNPAHTRPSSVAAIGHSFVPHTNTPEPANHEYDVHDFFDALAADNLPAVSFLKAQAFQDGHAGYSDPIDEQHFLVQVINALQKSPEWSETAVIILYDDSDGWYDHQMPPVVNPSFIAGVDTLNGTGLCFTSNGFQQNRPLLTTTSTPLNGTSATGVQGRCGYGTRMPLLMISPFAKKNFIDHTLTDQSSVLRFVEDNWLNGQRIQPGGSFDTIAGPLNNMFDFDRHDEDSPRKLILDGQTGTVISASGDDDDHRRDGDDDHHDDDHGDRH
jgi:phospholipase C